MSSQKNKHSDKLPSTSFEFKTNDIKGETTLKAIAKADRFNSWMYETIQPYLGKNILEIGSGIGNISRLALNSGRSVFLTDIRENYCAQLQTQFAAYKNLLGVETVDLVRSDFDVAYHDLLNKFDSVFALNVIEHIEDDTAAIINMSKLAKENGAVIVLVPSYNKMYNALDKALEHYRRYTTSHLSMLFENAGLEIIHKQYFNATGIPAWFISGYLLKDSVISEGKMSAYNALVPVFKIIDKMLLHKIGLSTIVVGRKQPD